MTPPSPPAMRSRDALGRLAVACLAAHAALTLFSAYAFATFLTGSPPAWLASPESQRALALGWRLGPATTVVLGALAGLLHATGRLGPRRALAIFAASFAIALSSELLGTATGFPFGPYGYTPLLGWRVAGLVPFNIPTSWFYMLYASLAICARVLPAEPPPSPGEGRATRRAVARHRWRWAVAAALVLTAWDVSMDPAMVRTAHWTWRLPAPETQSTLERLLLGDLFYGMPLSNWLGWLLTGTVIARVMLALVPPAEWARHVAPTRVPLVLYAVNGVLPITICARHGMWWAAGLGAAAMLVPLALAIRRPRAEPVVRGDDAAPVLSAVRR